MSSVAQIFLIIVIGVIVMMLIATFFKRGLVIERGRIVFWPPEKLLPEAKADPKAEQIEPRKIAATRPRSAKRLKPPSGA